MTFIGTTAFPLYHCKQTSHSREMPRSDVLTDEVRSGASGRLSPEPKNIFTHLSLEAARQALSVGVSVTRGMRHSVSGNGVEKISVSSAILVSPTGRPMLLSGAVW